MIIVSLVGLKKSGKTTCAEALVGEFKGRGMKTGTVKSMVRSDYTIDPRGKDTRRHREAGADFVISLAANEMAYIEKQRNRSRLDEFMRHVPGDAEMLICEGLADPDPGIIRIMVAESLEMLAETFRVRGPQDNVIALTGIVANHIKEHDLYPVFNCLEPDEARELADLILRAATSTR